jgi:hypothetical protein
MNCFAHGRTAAVGMCAFCQKGVCHECVAIETPRLMCRPCAARGSVWPYGVYGFGYKYKSSTTIGGWPHGRPGARGGAHKRFRINAHAIRRPDHS